MGETTEMSGSGDVAKIAFRMDKSTKATPEGAQMTVESIRIKQEVADTFQFDKDYLTEEVVLNGQDKTAVTGSLNLPKTLPGRHSSNVGSKPCGTVDTDTGEITPPEKENAEVTLTAHLSDGEQTAEFTLQVTVIAPKESLLKQTTYGSKEEFLADYTVTGSDADATVSLQGRKTNGCPCSRKQRQCGGNYKKPAGNDRRCVCYLCRCPTGISQRTYH